MPCLAQIVDSKVKAPGMCNFPAEVICGLDGNPGDFYYCASFPAGLDF